MMDCRAVDHVGGGGQRGDGIQALTNALENVNLNNSTEDKKRQRNKAKNARRKRKLQEKAVAAATASGNSGPTVVRAAIEGNPRANMAAQNAQSAGRLNTKRDQKEKQSTETTATGTTVKADSAKSKKRQSKRNGPGSNVKDYRKVLTVYQCENEGCKKTWNSAHGWTALSGLYCEYCDLKAKVTKTVEGMIWVEDFRCRKSGCDNTWIFPHDPENVSPEQECDFCGSLVTSGGAQLRFGRQYWIACQNRDCGIEWEEVSMKKEYTQRCTKCNNPGAKLGTRTETAGQAFARRRGGGGGGHNIQSCEMCQKLIREGVASSCTGKKRVIMKVIIEDGVMSDRIIATE